MQNVNAHMLMQGVNARPIISCHYPYNAPRYHDRILIQENVTELVNELIYLTHILVVWLMLFSIFFSIRCSEHDGLYTSTL